MSKTACGLFAATLFSISSLLAVDSTWQLVNDGSWFTGANWNNGIPNDSTSTARFDLTYTSPDVAISSPVELGTLILAPGNPDGIILDGNSLSINVEIDHLGEVQSFIRCPLVLENVTLIQSNMVLQSQLNLESQISGSFGPIFLQSFALIKGPGNTYEGFTDVGESSDIKLNTDSGVAIPGDLKVSESAKVTCLKANQIASTSSVEIADGTLDLGGFAQTISGLEMTSDDALLLNSANLKISPSTAPIVLDGTIDEVKLEGETNPTGFDIEVKQGKIANMNILSLEQLDRKLLINGELTLNKISAIELSENAEPDSALRKVDLDKDGIGKMTLLGSETNTFSGSFTMSKGTTVLGKTGGAKATLSTEVFVGSEATMESMESNQFVTGLASISMKPEAKWAMGTKEEEIKEMRLERRAEVSGTNQICADRAIEKLQENENGKMTFLFEEAALAAYPGAKVNPTLCLRRDDPQGIAFMDDEEENTSAEVASVQFDGGKKMLSSEVTEEVKKPKIKSGFGTTTEIRKVGEGGIVFEGTHEYLLALLWMDEGELNLADIAEAKFKRARVSALTNIRGELGIMEIGGTDGGDESTLDLADGTEVAPRTRLMAAGKKTVRKRAPTGLTAAGSRVGRVELADELEFNVEGDSSTSNNLAVDGGSGSAAQISKRGSGRLIFSNNHDYLNSNMDIEEGSFRADGTVMIPTMIIRQPARLEGNGTIEGAVTVNGTLAPGASIGTLNFVGEQTLTSVSNTEIEFDGTSADQINITGGLTIESGATLTLVPLGSNFPTSQFDYTVITTTTGITGDFNYVLDANPLLFQFNPVLSGDMLVFELNYTPLASLPFSGNPRRVAQYLEVQNPAAGSDFADVLAQIYAIENLDTLNNALNQLHPAPLKGLAISSEVSTIRVRSSLTNRLRLFQDPCCVAPRDCFQGWIDLQGSFLHQDKRKGQFGFDTNGGSATIGLDYRTGQNGVVGIAGAYSYDQVCWKKVKDSGDIHAAYGMLYAGWQCNCFFLNGAVTGAGNWYSTKRKIDFEDIDRKAKASFGGWEIAGHVDMGYEWGCNWITTPFVSVDYIYLYQDAFKEKGASSLNLKVDSSDYNFLRGEAGFYFDQCVCGCNGQFTFEEKLSYVREERFGGKKYTAKMKGGVGIFNTFGLSPDRNLFSPALAIYYTPNNRCYSLWLKYEGDFGSHYWQQNVHVGVLF